MSYALREKGYHVKAGLRRKPPTFPFNEVSFFVVLVLFEEEPL
jgi:hypothetical protein